MCATVRRTEGADDLPRRDTTAGPNAALACGCGTGPFIVITRMRLEQPISIVKQKKIYSAVSKTTSDLDISLPKTLYTYCLRRYFYSVINEISNYQNKWDFLYVAGDGRFKVLF
jgi:hypothetical protein